MDSAAEKGYLDIVKFLHENRSEGCASEALNAATKSGCVNMVQYLQEFVTDDEERRSVVHLFS